jgi:hypothetical protein
LRLCASAMQRWIWETDRRHVPCPRLRGLRERIGGLFRDAARWMMRARLRLARPTRGRSVQ